MTSDDLDRQVKTLSEWFEKNQSRLRHEESATVADELAGQLLRIDGRLGVEVGEGRESDREVILTAFSEPDAFSLVHSIVTSLSAQDGWRFVALKPPRGFAFNISLGGNRVEAKAFGFVPLRDVEAGICLIPPPGIDLPDESEREELGWLLVETGIGEELAGVLQHVEISASLPGRETRRPIAELAGYVRSNWIQ